MRIIIIGAGPTGLGAAWRLHELGHDDYLLYERSDHVGGLAASHVDDLGFTWDFAVHVLHSHYDYFDRVMERILPDGFLTLPRRSWVRTQGVYVPYPFQYNFRHLPEPARTECLRGLEQAAKQRPAPNAQSYFALGQAQDFEGQATNNYQLSTDNYPASFAVWIEQTFGDGIAKHFMLPYNRKIWSTDPREMGTQWMGERVPDVDLGRVKRNIEEGRDDVDWGPNAVFQFPKSGGTGAIWNGIAERLPEDRVRLNCEVKEIDVDQREIVLRDGSQDRYDALISTMPMPDLAETAGLSDTADWAGRLKHTHTHVVCIAPEQPIPQDMEKKTWLYCPDAEQAFYRVTPFSIFSSAHVPDISRYSSFMCEVSQPGDDPMMDTGDYVDSVIEGLRSGGILDCVNKNAHVYAMAAKYGYPVPTMDRDQWLDRIQPALEKYSIYSRGRFGGWKYEAGNMDHCFMQGAECVQRLLNGGGLDMEPTLFNTAWVNSGGGRREG